MPKRIYRLGELQLKIMKYLWECSEGTAAGIHQHVGQAEGLAFTTIATMLRKMDERGLVKHRAEGRTFIYQPVATEEEVSKSMTHDLLDRLFEGSVSSLLTHLLSTREVSAEEVKRLQQLLKEKKARK
jgi:BlaI family transcriptional regulator, penicillinase repressor